MAIHTSIMLFVGHILLLLGLPACLVQAVPLPQDSGPAAVSSGYWVANINRQGRVAFGNDTSYNVFRNVKDFGAKGTSLRASLVTAI